jgi:aarF domain-containing kinase
VGGVQQSWQDIFNDAETILYREIDYRDEADNAIRFANDFGLGYGGKAVESTAKGVDGNVLPSASEWLRSPYTYKELSSEKFLVMEFVPSIKVSSNDKLDKAGVTVEDREYLAEALAHSYLRQFCVNRFFSTDPHPGNLGIEVFEDGSPPRLVFYDFGQACSLADDQAGGILEVIESIIDSDAKKSVIAFKRMGVLKDGADLAKVEAKCQSNYDTGKLKVKKRKRRKSARYSKASPSVVADSDSEKVEVKTETSLDKQGSNSTKTTTEVKDSEVMEFFTLQSEYAFVARALSQMDGVGKGLDPEFDFISAAAPYLVEIKGTKRYLVDEAKKKLRFVYDAENGILAKEMNLFKSLGFEPKKYVRVGSKLK